MLFAKSIQLLLLGCIFILTSLSTQARRLPSHAISSQPHLYPPLFAVRGGAFFGFGKNKKSNSGGDDPDSPKRFPALSKEEIEDKLSIPIYGITDLNGNGVILSDGGEHIFHFFLNRHMAEAATKAVAAANKNAPELKVSAFHLGKCWFRLIESSGDRMFTVRSPYCMHAVFITITYYLVNSSYIFSYQNVETTRVKKQNNQSIFALFPI